MISIQREAVYMWWSQFCDLEGAHTCNLTVYDVPPSRQIEQYLMFEVFGFFFNHSPPDNVKAYYKRAKAHAAVWNEAEARADFSKVVQLDPSLEQSVTKELGAMEEKLRSKNKEEKGRYKGLFDFNTPPATATTVSLAAALLIALILLNGFSTERCPCINAASLMQYFMSSSSSQGWVWLTEWTRRCQWISRWRRNGGHSWCFSFTNAPQWNVLPTCSSSHTHANVICIPATQLNKRSLNLKVGFWLKRSH